MGGGGCKVKQDVVPQQINKNHFNFVRVVGKGGFAKVWKVTDKKTKQTYAMKVIDKAKVITKKSVQSVMNQRQILSHLQQGHSDFLVNMKCAFQDRDNLYMMMDYLQGGDLRHYIARNYHFEQSQIKFLVRCLIEGLNFLHQRNIIHRDIKPENIIFQKSGYVRITDMGIARYWKSQNSHQTSGTPGYMAPQVLLRQNHSFCADFYAVGVVAYELVVGKRPYNGRERKQIRQQMLGRQAKLPGNFMNKISKQGADFINKLLQRTSRKRLGYNGIGEIINHPWLAMKYQQKVLFYQKKIPSNINTFEIPNNPSLQQNTQPDDVWRQNILLLKKPDVQKMFQNYDYIPGLTDKKRQTSSVETVATLSNYNTR